MTNEERFKEIYRTQITRTGAPELLAWLESTDFFHRPGKHQISRSLPRRACRSQLERLFRFD